MAVSREELNNIYTQAVSYADPGAPTANEIAAHDLLRRIETAVWEKVNAVFRNGDSDNENKTNFKLAYRATIESQTMARQFLIIILGDPAAAAQANADAVRALSGTALDNVLSGAVMANFATALRLSLRL